eukprot:scaffold53304_cov27-Tisochrysis_lutea.AAC.2
MGAPVSLRMASGACGSIFKFQKNQPRLALNAVSCASAYACVTFFASKSMASDHSPMMIG